MSFIVWSASNAAERRDWESAWQNWPDREVFARPAYAELFCGAGDAAICAAWQSPSVYVLYPLIVRRIPTDAHSVDLITPYGYGGPFVWGKEADRRRVESDFWAEYTLWARRRAAVSEFVRFSLFTDNLLSDYPGVRSERTPNVVRSLDLGEEALWRTFEHKVRKNVNRARNTGVQVFRDDSAGHFSEFFRIYTDTMKRRNANAGYYFPETFFQAIHRDLPGCFQYFHACVEDRVVSTELVLVSQNSVYSFLGGTDEGWFDHRPNDLLKFEIIRWAAGAGKKAYVLGGGYTPGDGIFRYKLSFAPDGVRPFYVGQRILNEDAYSGLIHARQKEDSQWHPRPEFFPAYRS